jgi:hypothetical protein
VEILATVTVAILQCRDEWTVRVVPTAFREQLVSDLIARYPDVVGPGKIDLSAEVRQRNSTE